jgi:hypothetical protein
MKSRHLTPFLFLLIATAPAAFAEEESMASIAEKLNNPVASMISVPFQNNFDWGGGPDDDGFQYKMNFQPVIPISLNDDWNLIARTILPFISQDDRIGTGSETGLGDTTATFFFSPAKNGPGEPIWGLGPALLLPTATDDVLGTEKWGAGPAGLILMQEHGWTYGALVTQLWSFAGADDRNYVNQTLLQPFLSYTTPQHTSYTVNLESVYDWHAEEWTVPVNLMVSQLVKIGDAPVNFQLGARYYMDKPSGGPDWGLRFAVTLVIPKS